MFTALALGPNVSKMSAGSAREFNAKVLPKLVNFMQASIGSTIIFGLLLLYFFSNGDFSWLSATIQGNEVSAGMVLAFATAVIAWGFTIPPFKRVSKLSAAVAGDGPQAPPPEMMAYAKRARLGSTVGVVLLLIALATMVAAGF